MTLCENLAQAAMKTEGNSSAWNLWQEHAQTCQSCEKNITVWQELEKLAGQPGERLGDLRVQALKDALAHQKRTSSAGWNLRWLGIAGIAAVVIMAILFVPEKEPFTMTDSPSRWAQIAANPDWDLKAEHPLRDRIQTLRDDFRAEKMPEMRTTEKERLKNRLQRFRETLSTEF